MAETCKFGFLLNGEGQSEANDFRCHNYSHSPEESAEVRAEWTALLEHWEETSPVKIETALRAGVPQESRGVVWGKLLKIDQIRTKADFTYSDQLEKTLEVEAARAGVEDANDELRREWAKNYGKDGVLAPPPVDDELDDGKFPTSQAIKQIKLDLHRTFYTHKSLAEKGGDGQQTLHRILAVYARINPKVGYCQGMSYIGAVLLMNMPEESAFWCFYALMESPTYFEGFYSQSLDRVQYEAQVFAELVVVHQPALAAHMDDLGIHPLMYVTPWFMCSMTSIARWDTVMMIWDRMMLSGSQVLLHAALAILTNCTEEMLEMDSLGTLLPYLQHVPVRKIERESFGKAYDSIPTAEFVKLVGVAKKRVEEATARGKAAIAPSRETKRVRSEGDEENSFSSPLSKKVRGSVPAKSTQPGDIAVPPTPSVFRRIMDSLATPLRNRARMDGAQTPKPRSQDTFWSKSRQSAQGDRPARLERTSSLTSMFRKSRRVGGPAIAAVAEAPAYMHSPLGVRSPLVADNSPFGRSGILSPSYRGYVPARVAPLVALDSPSQGQAFTQFSEATSRRDSPLACGDKAASIELQPLKMRQL